MTLQREETRDEADSTTRRSAWPVSATADSTTAVPASPARDGRERAHVLLGYRRCPLSRLRSHPGHRPRNRRPPGRRGERRRMSATPDCLELLDRTPFIPPPHPANERLCHGQCALRLTNYGRKASRNEHKPSCRTCRRCPPPR